MLNRIHERDIQAVGNDGSGCRAARVVPDALLSRESAQVPHDQEVGIESHLVDDAKFVIQPISVLVLAGAWTVSPVQSLFTQLSEITLGRLALRQVEGGKAVALEIEFYFRPFGNPERIFDSPLHLPKQRGHFLGRAKVVRIIGHTHAIRVTANRTGLNAKQDVLQVGLLRQDVVHVVGRDEPRLVLRRQVE